MHSLSVVKSMATGLVRSQRLYPLFSWPNIGKSISPLAPNLGLARHAGIGLSYQHPPQARAFRTYDCLREDNSPQKDVATKSDIFILRKEIEGDMKDCTNRLALWKADISSIVRNHDSDMKAEVAGLGKERNRLERDMKVQFSKLSEDTIIGIDHLKTAQTNLKGELSALSLQLSDYQRELSSQLNIKVLEVGERMLTRENRFLVRVLLLLSTTLVVGSVGAVITAWGIKSDKTTTTKVASLDRKVQT